MNQNYLRIIFAILIIAGCSKNKAEQKLEEKEENLSLHTGDSIFVSHRLFQNQKAYYIFKHRRKVTTADIDKLPIEEWKKTKIKKNMPEFPFADEFYQVAHFVDDDFYKTKKSFIGTCICEQGHSEDKNSEEKYVMVKFVPKMEKTLIDISRAETSLDSTYQKIDPEHFSSFVNEDGFYMQRSDITNSNQDTLFY